MKMELNDLRMTKELSDTPEQILCIREHLQNLVCVTVTLKGDGVHNILDIFFKVYLLGSKKCISECVIGKSPCEARLNDFKIIDVGINEYYRNQGYGSLFLKEIIKYAKSFSPKKIIGDIYSGDTSEEDKKAMLYHFYEKHGFVIDEDKRRLIMKTG